MRPEFAYARGRWDAWHKFAADNTSMAFANNASQGNPSNINPGFANTCIDGTINNLGGSSLAVRDQGGIDTPEEFLQVDQAALGAKAAAEAFKVAPPPKPASPTTAGRSAASPVPKPAAPVQPVKPAVPPTSPVAAPLPPSSAQAVASTVGGAQLQQAVQQPMKLISPAAKLAGISDRDYMHADPSTSSSTYDPPEPHSAFGLTAPTLYGIAGGVTDRTGHPILRGLATGVSSRIGTRATQSLLSRFPALRSIPLSELAPDLGALLGAVGGNQLSGHLLRPDRGEAKLSEFRQGLLPDPKPRPGEIQPTNGQRELGTNFETAHYDRTVSRGFDALKSQKNLDLLNAGNEAAIGSPGV